MDIRLRKIRFTDAPHLIQWRNENKEYFPPQPDFTLASHAHWFWEIHAYDPADHMFMVLVMDGGEEEGAGTIAFNSRTREIGRVLLGDKRYERQGIMSQALRLIMEAFGGGPYWLNVRKDNATAIAFYEKNGFKQDTYEDLTGKEMRTMYCTRPYAYFGWIG